MTIPFGGFNFPEVNLPKSAAASPEGAISFLAQELVEQNLVQSEHKAQVISGVLKREFLGSTAVGGGVAIPHCISDFVAKVTGVIGRSAEGISWPGCLDGVPVQFVCLIVTPVTKPGDGIRALEAVVRHLRSGS